jgi:DMSO/TMAO reductase YedYZ molybdopterin-dependent catalytic subunit
VGALLGLVSAAVALGVGEIVAAFVRPQASPVIVVGDRVIALTPEAVKRWAIRTFGTGDKTALLTGIYVVIAVLAMLVGVLALRRLAYGLAGIALFGALGLYAALSTPAHRGADAVPTILGALAAAGVLVGLTRSAGGAAPRSGPGFGPDRRRFLQGSAAAAGLATVAGFGGRAAQHARYDVAAARAGVALPAAADAAPALPAATDLGKSGQPWVTPNGDFYRIDTALSVPQVDPGSWSLRIHGMVDREVTVTYQQLLARPLIERWITLCCVSNDIGGDLIGNARFLGARLADLLREAGVHDGADQLLMTSADQMTIGAPTAVVMDGRDAMVAVGMNGSPLPITHGFPARIVVPGLYGYVSACKWVVDIEATTFAARQAYWVQGGWTAQTDIKLESRIDTPRNGGRVGVGAPVAIAGVAWDQHVGVSRVEVQIDDGPWTAARLAEVPSTDTWRQWVLPWTPPRAGSYRVRVRATDASGRMQPTAVRGVFPDGATGLHTITVRAG